MMKNTRRKMCKHCAFRDDSIEMSQNPDDVGDFIMTCMKKKFYCHETMKQNNPEKPKWEGNFDPTKKPNGTEAKYQDHQVCAGFMLMFAEEYGLDVSDIPTENHHFCGGKNE